MNLRKTLALGAAIAAAALLTLAPTAQASTPTGGAANYIGVNGTTAAGAVAVEGAFKQGTATFNLLNFTVSCVGGTVGGTVDRGARAGTDFAFSTLNIVCATPLGINATISISGAAGCNPLGVTFPAPPTNLNVHDGLTDLTAPWGTWFAGAPGTAKFHNVLQGNLNVPLKCITLTMPGGCSAMVDGNVAVQFSEAISPTSGNYQGLILNGAGLTLRNATPACFGLWTGGVTLNAIKFNIRPTAASGGGNIDFRVKPVRLSATAHSPVARRQDTVTGPPAIPYRLPARPGSHPKQDPHLRHMATPGRHRDGAW